MRYIGSYEAKTHLPRLLDEVAAGTSITITKRGVPVAVLVPAVGRDADAVRGIAASLRAFRKGRRLDDVTIRDLIDEGRR